MSLLDRYIIGRFLSNFVILFALLFSFAVAIDLLLQLDRFVDVAQAQAGDAGALLDSERIIVVPERALALLGIAIIVLAAGLLTYRLQSQ